MSDPTQIVASKPAATSTTIQGAVAQLVVSLTAIAVLIHPQDAAKIHTIGDAIVNYIPMAAAIIAAAAPFIMTVAGRFKATQPLH